METGATNSVTDSRPPLPDIRPWLFVPVLYVMQTIPATLVREKICGWIFGVDLGMVEPC